MGEVQSGMGTAHPHPLFSEFGQMLGEILPARKFGTFQFWTGQILVKICEVFCQPNVMWAVVQWVVQQCHLRGTAAFQVQCSVLLEKKSDAEQKTFSYFSRPPPRPNAQAEFCDLHVCCVFSVLAKRQV